MFDLFKEQYAGNDQSDPPTLLRIHNAWTNDVIIDHFYCPNTARHFYRLNIQPIIDLDIKDYPNPIHSSEPIICFADSLHEAFSIIQDEDFPKNSGLYPIRNATSYYTIELTTVFRSKHKWGHERIDWSYTADITVHNKDQGTDFELGYNSFQYLIADLYVRMVQMNESGACYNYLNKDLDDVFGYTIMGRAYELDSVDCDGVKVVEVSRSNILKTKHRISVEVINSYGASPMYKNVIYIVQVDNTLGFVYWDGCVQHCTATDVMLTVPPETRKGINKVLRQYLVNSDYKDCIEMCALQYLVMTRITTDQTEVKLELNHSTFHIGTEDDVNKCVEKYNGVS